jgi:hypothetical protein
MTDFAATHRAHLEGQLEPGEELLGICAATQHSTFSGKAVAIGVSERRLLIQPLDRRGRPDGVATLLAPDQITSVRATDAGGMSLGAVLMDSAAATLVLHTTEGGKLKLTMMRGTGMLGGLGGGEPQREGVEALAAWFRRLEAGGG